MSGDRRNMLGPAASPPPHPFPLRQTRGGKGGSSLAFSGCRKNTPDWGWGTEGGLGGAGSVQGGIKAVVLQRCGRIGQTRGQPPIRKLSLPRSGRERQRRRGDTRGTQCGWHGPGGFPRAGEPLAFTVRGERAANGDCPATPRSGQEQCRPTPRVHLQLGPLAETANSRARRGNALRAPRAPGDVRT